MILRVTLNTWSGRGGKVQGTSLEVHRLPFWLWCKHYSGSVFLEGDGFPNTQGYSSCQVWTLKDVRGSRKQELWSMDIFTPEILTVLSSHQWDAISRVHTTVELNTITDKGIRLHQVWIPKQTNVPATHRHHCSRNAHTHVTIAWRQWASLSTTPTESLASSRAPSKWQHEWRKSAK